MSTASSLPEIRDTPLTAADVHALVGRPHILIDCVLEEIDLASIDLTGWAFERCDLRRADFGGARLEQTRWQSCRGAFANFTGSDLGDAIFTASDFNNASFRRCNLGGARFSRCKLTGADLSDPRALDIHFDETLLINAKMQGHSFRNATLTRMDFSQADIRKCDFRSVRFEECSLRDALVDGARFEGADLREADIGGVRLGDASRFRGATISRDQAGQLLSEVGLKVR